MTKWKVAIVVVILIAAGMLYAQNRAASVGTVNLSKEEIESFLNSLPPEQLRSIATQPEAKKQFVDRLKEMFTLSLEAERIGIDSRPEVQSDMGLLEKVMLAQIFREKKATTEPKAIEVTEADKAEYFKTNPNAYEQFMAANPRFKNAPPEQAERLKTELAELLILVDRAKRTGFDKDPAYQMAFKVQRASYLAGRMQQELRSTTPVTDADMKDFFEKNKEQRFEETRASHILVMFPEQREQKAAADPSKPADTTKPATKEEALKKAQELLTRVKAGEDFAKLAKENSDDTGSGQQGGDLGYFRKDVRFVQEFKDAVFKLKPGEVSDIVQTQFGYHIIKVTDRRPANFDDTLKAELKDEILDDNVKKRIDALKEKNLVKIDENFTMPTPPPAPPAPEQPQGPMPPVSPHGSPHGQVQPVPDDGHGHGAPESK